jgi:hypothetical protein
MLNDKELENIRRKMLELDEEPPVKAWATIQAEIKPRHRWRFFWWLSSALLLITAIGLFFFWDELSIHPIAPSASAHIPSIKPAPKAASQHNPLSELVTPQQPVTSSIKQKQPLPLANIKSGSQATKPNSERAALPANGISKKFTTPEEDFPTSASPDANTSKLANVPGNSEKKTDPEYLPKPTEKMARNSLPSYKIIPGKSSKPANEIAKLGLTSDKQIINSDKTNPIPVSKSNLTIKPDTQQQPTVHSIGEQEPASETSNPISIISNKKVDTLIQAPVIKPLIEISNLDSASIAFEKDTASQAKEIIIITTPTSKGSKEWMVGLFFSPRYSFRVVTPSSSDDIYIEKLTNRRKSGSERMGYELGVSVSKSITNHLYLESSLAFMQLKENLSYSYTTSKVDTLLRKGSSDGQQIQLTAVYASGNRQLISSYAYGGWRLGATYYFWQNRRRRFNITMNGGINLLVKGQTREVINAQESRTIYFPSKENILEQTNYNLLIGAGYSMQILEKYELMFMPTLNYFLGSTFKAREPFGLQPYSLGIHVQVKRRLK